MGVGVPIVTIFERMGDVGFLARERRTLMIFTEDLLPSTHRLEGKRNPSSSEIIYSPRGFESPLVPLQTCIPIPEAVLPAAKHPTGLWGTTTRSSHGSESDRWWVRAGSKVFRLTS